MTWRIAVILIVLGITALFFFGLGSDPRHIPSPLIGKEAPAFTAQKMIDFVYDPEIQAAITAYVNYVPPVKGTREILREQDPEIAENELIFPDLSQAHNFKTFSPEEERQIDEAFQRAIGA
jgi:spermidine/putrescine-binding protein